MSIGSFTQRNGWKAEELAAEYLRENGFTVTEVNKDKESGKPYDLLAQSDDAHYAINVKSAAENGFGFVVGFGNMARLVDTGESLKITPAYLFVRRDSFLFFSLEERHSNIHYSKQHITIEPIQINKFNVPDLLSELSVCQRPIRDGKCPEHGRQPLGKVDQTDAAQEARK